MLFSQKLNDEVYEPWREHYIAYDQLKKLLKESNPTAQWTDADETRFVETLDKELDKVYGFETKKFDEISERIGAVEQQVSRVQGTEPHALDAVLEQILQDATHIDKFRRLNYTGFTKLVRKHDRLHPQYHVMPLLHARLRALPFHGERYSPLLKRLGEVFTKIDGSGKPGSHVPGSVRAQKFHSRGYVTLQFWVHPDDLMEVKTRVLRRLPVLVYNREDDDEADRDPYVTSLYLDNSDFALYKSTLDIDEAQDDSQLKGKTLRLRWYGSLSEKPEIVLEEHDETDGRITRINIKEKAINKFLAGNDEVVKKQARKMRERHASQQAVEDYETAAKELMSMVCDNHLQPLLRTVYRRTAFEIPGDDRVRVILDQDILFLREDAFNKDRPIRDPSNWHRPDLDMPGRFNQQLLRKGEFARFPYSVLEVRLKSDADKGVETLPWINELCSSNLIKEIPHFTKFLQGVAVLYGDNENLDSLPFWLSELDPKHEGETPNAASSSADLGANPGVPTLGNSKFTPAKFTAPKFDSADEEEFDSEDSGLLDEVIDGDIDVETNPEDYVGVPTRISKLDDEESEDDEVFLPPGVEAPAEWIKNQSSPKVEAKVWLANERTFNKWLHITCLLSALTFTLYSSVSRAASPHIATIVSYVLFALTIFSGLWGYSQYLLRVKYIKERGDRPMDAPLGPLVVAIGLFLALVLNFVAMYKGRSMDHTKPVPSPTHGKKHGKEAPMATNTFANSSFEQVVKPFEDFANAAEKLI